MGTGSNVQSGAKSVRRADGLVRKVLGIGAAAPGLYLALVALRAPAVPSSQVLFYCARRLFWPWGVLGASALAFAVILWRTPRGLPLRRTVGASLLTLATSLGLAAVLTGSPAFVAPKRLALTTAYQRHVERTADGLAISTWVENLARGWIESSPEEGPHHEIPPDEWPRCVRALKPTRLLVNLDARTATLVFGGWRPWQITFRQPPIRQDIPYRAQVEADWLRQDGVGGPGSDWHAAAANALGLAQRTLHRVLGRLGHTAGAGIAEDLEERLTDLERVHAADNAAADWQRLYLETRWLRRRIALADPLLAFDDLLVVKRPPPLRSHCLPQYLGRQSRSGPGLTILSGWRDEPDERPLLPADALPLGAVLHPDLSFDGRRVIFSFCDHTVSARRDRRFLIYEAEVDGSYVRQLTGASGRDAQESTGGQGRFLVEDFDPCYVPGGGFVFVSTRTQTCARCLYGLYEPAYVLHRAEADGSHIRRISANEVNEWDPSILHNGQVVYTRWDYINRHTSMFQSLWTTRPDGRGTAHLYGNYTRDPRLLGEARAIPGSGKILCTGAAHCSYTAGALVVVDPDAGQDGPAPIKCVTPEVPFPHSEECQWPLGAYATPWPLSEDLFLTAYSPYRLTGEGRVQRENAYGVYLVDTLGGRELIYRDPAVSSFSPIPLRPRPEPPVMPSVREPRSAYGTFYCGDVYASTEPIPRGAVKRLRVVKLIPQFRPTAARRGVVDDEIVKRILGTVPVSEKGGTAFRAPADTPLLFQLLDENDMAVMTMRSLAYVQPGETMGCIGCHEPRNMAPAVTTGYGRAAAGRKATLLAVHEIDPRPGPSYAGGFSFARSVQPILDRSCIRCHGLKGTAGGLNLIGRRGREFSQSYEALMGRPGLVSVMHLDVQPDVTRYRQCGAHASRLPAVLSTGHHEHVTLDRADRQRLMQWMDLNAQYFGDYEFERPERRDPSPGGTAALRDHVGKTCGSCHAGMARQPFAALVNIAAPSESRALKAPLTIAAGGWGQCRQSWGSIDDARYQAMRDRVLVAVGPR